MHPFQDQQPRKLPYLLLRLKVLQLHAKPVNTAVGGNYFSMNDIVGDVVGTGVSIAIPGAEGLVGAATGEIVDKIIDSTAEEEEKNKEENGGTE